MSGSDLKYNVAIIPKVITVHSGNEFQVDNLSVYFVYLTKSWHLHIFIIFHSSQRPEDAIQKGRN